MIVNDIIYLLDKSFDLLKAIYLHEQKINNPVLWNAESAESRNEQQQVTNPL
jgi:hypothetical protein